MGWVPWLRQVINGLAGPSPLVLDGGDGEARPLVPGLHPLLQDVQELPQITFMEMYWIVRRWARQFGQQVYCNRFLNR